MKNFVLLISALVTLIGCKDKPQPQPPATRTEPTPAPTPRAEPEKEMVVTSSRAFVLANGYDLNTMGPRWRDKGRTEETVTREKYQSYAVFTSPAGNSVGVVKLPEFRPGGSVNLDGLTGVLNTPGWQVTPRVRSLVLKDEFGPTEPTRELTVVGQAGEGSKGKTIAELSSGPGLWVVTTPGVASPDFAQMAINPAELSAFINQVKASENFANTVKVIREGKSQYGSISRGWNLCWLAGRFRVVDQAFRALPEQAQVTLVRAVGPMVIREAISQVGADVLRTYLADITWEQVVSAPLDLDQGGTWPHHDPSAPLPQFGGLSQQSNDDVGHALRFWARRGRPVFEASKAVAQTELAKK